VVCVCVCVCVQYPEIYRCVLIDRVAVPAGIENHAEMWSIGVTLYHVATGQLPFQPLGGRNNRSTMSVSCLLRVAVVSGHAKLVKRLIDEGVGINACQKDYRKSLLNITSFEGFTDIVRKLLDNGAATERRDNEVRTSLYCAVCSEHHDTVKLLVECDTVVNAW